MPIETQTVEITDIAYGGEGIARVDNFVFFVKDALPGQIVTLKNVVKRKSYARAEIDQVVKEAAYRQEAGCRYFGECGGCQWLNVPYPQQLKWKENFIRDAITRIAKQTCPESIAIHASEKDRHYRQRIRMKAMVNADGVMTLGFFKRGTTWVLNISECQIAAAPINSFLKHCTTWRFSGSFHCSFEFQLCFAEQSELAVTCYLTDKVSKKIRDEISAKISALPMVKYFRMSLDAADEYYVYDEQFGLQYLTAPGLFQQVNFAANRLARSKVRDKITSLKYTQLLDLFCGSGNLSLGLGNASQKVLGIEYSSEAIDAAKAAVRRNNLVNHTYLAGDAAKLLKQIVTRGEKYELVVTDPPRAGMPECVPLLLQLAPQHIIYLSCDPTTMARDVSRLCREDYELLSIEGFDFFPNTFHIETLVCLKQRKI